MITPHGKLSVPEKAEGKTEMNWSLTGILGGRRMKLGCSWSEPLEERGLEATAQASAVALAVCWLPNVVMLMWWSCTCTGHVVIWYRG